MNDKEMIEALFKNGVITEDEFNIILKRINKPTIKCYTVWGEILNQYYHWGIDKYNETTIKGYKVCLYGFAKYIENTEILNKALKNEFKGYDYKSVNSYISDLFSKGFDSQTISKQKYAISSFGEYLASINIDAPDITSIKVKKSNEDENKINVLREDEILNIVEKCDLRTKIVILLCYEAALKRIELTKIKIQNFNLKKRQLIIYDESETVIDRVCILSQKTIQYIEDYINGLYDDIARWNESRLKKGLPSREDKGFLFQNVKTTEPSYTMLQISMKKAARNYYNKLYDKEELEKYVNSFTFETLRNSRRVYLLAIGKSVTQVMTLVGDRNYMGTHRFQKYVSLYYPELIKL